VEREHQIDRFMLRSQVCRLVFTMEAASRKHGAPQRSPFDRPLVAVLEIVERDREVAGTRQCLAGVAADKAGTTGDQDGLHG
jgi:hypothetical protein